jgi:hypothetical protein
MSNGLFERFFSVLPMTVFSQAGKDVECKSHLDCFSRLRRDRNDGDQA